MAFLIFPTGVSRQTITRRMTGSFLCKHALNACWFAYGDTKGWFTKSLDPWGIWKAPQEGDKINGEASQDTQLEATSGQKKDRIAFKRAAKSAL